MKHRFVKLGIKINIDVRTGDLEKLHMTYAKFALVFKVLPLTSTRVNEFFLHP